jgi:hypothetical protein
VLDVGRKTRTVPAPIRRALTARDRRCLLMWSGRQRTPAGVTGRFLRVWDGTPFNVAYAIDVLHPRANQLQ